jgi:hypothetical protein
MEYEPRKKSLPVSFEISRLTRFSPGGCNMYYAHEWKAYQKSLYGGEPSDDPAQADAASTDPNSELGDPTSELTAASESTDPTAGNSSESSASPNPVTALTSTPSPISQPSPLPPDFARHARKCVVCSHPNRDAIEGDFIRWRTPELIAREYRIADRSINYRHVRSTGLYAWRRCELGRVLEGILESAEHVPLPSADIITRAARIYSHLDEHGNWFDPPRTTFIFTGPAPAIPLLKSDLPTNSGHKRKRNTKQRAGEQKANRNIRPIQKSIKSLKAKENPNS